MRVKPGHQRFNTPIEVGTISNVNTNNDSSVDEKIDTYLGDRRKRLLDEAKLAELEHVTEDEKTEAERSRRERELLAGGKLSPIGKEGDMEGTKEKIEDAAEVAAQAASAGVNPEDATALGTGKSKVVVIKPAVTGEKTEEGKGGWSVLNGRPIRDSEGEYTFSQALKVAQLEIPKPSGNEKKSLGEELAEAKMKLEALGIKVGSPPSTSPRPLKEEVAEAVTLLQTLGIHVGTSPQAPLKEQVAEAKSLLEGLGLSIGLPGESLELVKEKHHHVERMDEISADRDHNERLTDLASNIPENIGRGIGEDIRRHKGGPKGSPSSTLDKIKCDECGTEFVVSPEAMEKGEATCPKCGMVYKGEK